MAELIVVIQALKRGVEVFKNVCCTGPNDLCLYDEKRTPKHLTIDVKSMRANGQGAYGAGGDCCTTKQVVCLVNPFNEQIRWIRGKEPAGWEDFWN